MFGSKCATKTFIVQRLSFKVQLIFSFLSETLVAFSLQNGTTSPVCLSAKSGHQRDFAPPTFQNNQPVPQVIETGCKPVLINMLLALDCIFYLLTSNILAEVRVGKTGVPGLFPLCSLQWFYQGLFCFYPLYAKQRYSPAEW